MDRKKRGERGRKENYEQKEERETSRQFKRGGERGE